MLIAIVLMNMGGPSTVSIISLFCLIVDVWEVEIDRFLGRKED